MTNARRWTLGSMVLLAVVGLADVGGLRSFEEKVPSDVPEKKIIAVRNMISRSMPRDLSLTEGNFPNEAFDLDTRRHLSAKAPATYFANGDAALNVLGYIPFMFSS